MSRLCEIRLRSATFGGMYEEARRIIVETVGMSMTLNVRATEVQPDGESHISLREWVKKRMGYSWR